MNRLEKLLIDLKSLKTIDRSYYKQLTFLVNGPESSEAVSDPFTCSIPQPLSREELEGIGYVEDLEPIAEYYIDRNTTSQQLINFLGEFDVHSFVAVSTGNVLGDCLYVYAPQSLSDDGYANYLQDYYDRTVDVVSARSIVERNIATFYRVLETLKSIDTLSVFDGICLYPIIMEWNLQRNWKSERLGISETSIEEFITIGLTLLGIKEVKPGTEWVTIVNDPIKALIQ